MSIKDLVVSGKELREARLEMAMQVAGKCRYCNKNVKRGVALFVWGGRPSHRYCAKREFDKLVKCFPGPVKVKIKRVYYKADRRMISGINKRIRGLESESVGFKTLSFYLFGRQYTIKLKRHGRLEDLLIRNGKRLLKYRII